MIRPLATLASLTFLTAPHLLAQDVLHYKFDELCGSEVVNFGAAPSNAAIQTTTAGGVAAARVAGQFGQALTATAFPTGSGSTWLNTGWAPTTSTGSFSISMWLRNRPGNPNAIAFGYLFGANGGNFRLFTGGSGRLFLSSFPGSATSGVDLTSLLNAGWVHVACTVDGSSLQAIWYVNGAVDATIAITAPAALTGTDFAIGARQTNGSSPSPLETDEFVFSTNVWTPSEVLALASAPRAGDGNYTSGITTQCGGGAVTVDGAGGEPVIGNLNYGVTVTTATPSLFLLLAGLDKCNFGGAVPLPLDGTPLLPFLNGCWILTDAVVTLSGVTSAGPASVAFPIPATVPPGTSLYMQALGLDLATFAGSMSDGFAIGTGL